MPGLNLTPAVEVFPCPNCGETINTNMTQCNFCGIAIDRAAAEQAAAATAKVSSAVSDSSYIKIMFGVAGIFFLFRFAIIVAWLGVFGFIFFELAIPVMLIRWWLRYGRIQTSDPDFAPARRTVIIMSVAVILFYAARLFHVIAITPF